MKDTITKIRAALEMARDYITSDLASERGAFEGHEGLSRIGEIKADIEANDEALTALAELEKSAAEPVAWMYDKGDEEGLVTPFNPLTTPGHGGRKNIRPLYAAPPAPVAEIREVVVTRPMCHGAWARFWSEPNNGDSCDQALRWLEAWRSELGPTLGLVEIREPTPEECERICTEYEWLLMRECTCGGRDAFDAVRAVMWPKEGL